MIEDINGKKLEPGDIIDIHQTVNGERLFVVESLDPLEIRYYSGRAYEYDKKDLIAPCRFTGEPTFEIVKG